MPIEQVLVIPTTVFHDAGLFQGFAVSTSGSRTAVAEQSGAKSQLARSNAATVRPKIMIEEA